jgi:hypothetical protein
MPDLSDYRGQMLGGQNRHVERKREEEQEAKATPWEQRPVGTEGYRGLPCYPAAGGIDGTMDGTDPLQALLDKEDEGVLWVDWTPSRMPR